MPWKKLIVVFLLTPFLGSLVNSQIFASAQTYLQNDQILDKVRLQQVIDQTPIKVSQFTVADYTVIPIYIVPSGTTPNPAYVLAINQALTNIQSWYARELNGKTFRLYSAVDYGSSHPLSYFQCQTIGGNCRGVGWLNWESAITAAREIGFPIQTDPKQIHIIFVDAGGGSALGGMTGQEYNNSSHGVAVLDSWNLEGIANLYPHGPHSQDCSAVIGNSCGLDGQRGALAHEFGHTLSLPHPPDSSPSDCLNYNLMTDWWNYPNNHLSENSACPQKQTLSSSPFFFPTPTVTPTPVLTLVVCPTGVPGQGGCNYIGGNGVQQAVDVAPTGSPSQKTLILVRSGNYHRSEYTPIERTGRRTRKCFVNTREKNLILQGETNTILDGRSSTNMDGICSKAGEIEIRSLILVGFKKDLDECFDDQLLNTCSYGDGVALFENVNATIVRNTIKGNVWGIGLYNSATAVIKNNLIFDTGARGIDLTNQTSAQIINNTIFNNGLTLYWKSGITIGPEARPSLIKNNIIASNKGFGIEIFSPAQVEENYNLVWGNIPSNFAYGRSPGTGTISQDPKFVDPNTGDFHLMLCSPAKDAGNPAILDPNGSRSDMGVHGGPEALDFSPIYLTCPIITETPTPTAVPTTPTPTMTPPPGCITPTDRMLITSSLTLCPGTYNLSGDSGGALHVAGNNITIDGRGATLVGSGMNQFGIRGSNAQNITIIGITIKNYYYGIDFDHSENVKVISSNLSDNRKVAFTGQWFDINIPYESAYGGGLRFYQCNNCLVKNSVMRNNSVGIDWYYVTNSTIIDSDASWNNIFGVHLYGSTDNLIKRGEIHHNSPLCDQSTCWGGNDSAGLLLVVGSHRNKIFANDLRYSGDGFFIGNENGAPSNNNILIGNDGSFSPANAFETTFSDGNYYEGNYATNSSLGFWLGFSYNMTLTGNIASGNSVNGIDIEHGRNNQIIKNVAANNNGAGVKLHMNPHNTIIPRYPGSEHSQNNTVNNNLFYKNTYGIRFVMNRNSTVAGNLFLDNSTGFSTSGDHPEETGGNHENQNSLSCNPQSQTCGSYAVNANEGQIDTDFTQNYWGTTNEAEINSKISDKTQNPAYGEILYNPFATAPVNLTLPVLLIKYQNILRPTSSVTHIPQTIHPNCNAVSVKNKGRWTTYVWDFNDLPYNLTAYDLASLNCQTPRAL